MNIQTAPPATGVKSGKIKIPSLYEFENGLFDGGDTDFPLDAFNLVLQGLVNAIHKSLNFPIPFICAAILAVASSCIGNAARLKVKEGWNESAMELFLLVADPGTGKTHPVALMLRRLYELQRKSKSEYDTALAARSAWERLSKKEKEEGGYEEPPIPKFKQYVIGDISEEGTIEVLSHNPRGVLQHNDEGMGLVNNQGRYSKKSNGSETINSVFSNTDINNYRKSSGITYVSNPFLSFIGGIHPNTVREFAGERRSDNGNTDRMLIFWLDNYVKAPFNDNELDPQILATWDSIVDKLLLLPMGVDEARNPLPEIIKFTPKARELYKEWYQSNADEINATNDHTIKSVYSKFDIHVVRLSLIIHLLNQACATETDCIELKDVDTEAVESAIKLSAYLKSNALKFRAAISSNNSQAKYSDAAKQKLYSALPDKFKTGEALRIREELNILSDITVKRWLEGEQKLFKKVKHGEYEKCI